LAQLAEANTRADRAEHAIAGERARADGLRDRIEELNAQLADSKAGLATAQDAAERAGTQAEAAQHGEREARRALEAARAGGRWTRLRRAWRGEGAG
jgi:predicted  nucleic acid-binding Zn-ribbon protein